MTGQTSMQSSMLSEWKAAHPAMRFTIKALCLVIVVAPIALALAAKPAPTVAPASIALKADRIDHVNRPALPPYNPNRQMPGYAPAPTRSAPPQAETQESPDLRIHIHSTPRGSYQTISTTISPGITMTRTNVYPKR